MKLIGLEFDKPTGKDLFVVGIVTTIMVGLMIPFSTEIGGARSITAYGTFVAAYSFLGAIGITLNKGWRAIGVIIATSVLSLMIGDIVGMIVF